MIFYEAYLTSICASLYDGGWRSNDADELIREYELTKEETDAICKVLAKYEQAEQENDEYM